MLSATKNPAIKDTNNVAGVSTIISAKDVALIIMADKDAKLTITAAISINPKTIFKLFIYLSF
jgi:hypothetical protein